jgi:class 3 adenylate cyclase/predicted ATPase
MDLGRWLRSLGLQQYEAVFRENAIDETVLPDLTDQDLEKLGVLLGHRRKLLRAIASLNAAPAIPTSAAPPATPICQDAAERRQVTVMFSDLVGSTALSARMDPEDLREIIAAYQKCVTETVGRFGGFVAKYMGDGVLVYFGYPQAHEDDAERAVRAGLELVAAVGSLKTRVTLQTRVGIATGLVVVGDLIGSGASQEQAIVGETPNLAARLQAIAQPNGVVIAGSTRKLVGNLFELDDLGSQDLKGFAGSARAWATLRPVFAESRFEALHASGLTELVGREEELEILLRRWSKAKAGEGQVVLLAGEPGVGKSRVCQAIFARLSSEPHMRLRYFCSPHHQNSAFYPIIIQLERAAGIRREDSVEQRLDKLEAILAQAIREPRDAAPLLAALLSIPTCGRYPSLNLSPQKQKEKTLKALLAQVEGLARRQPVMMLVEDAHWMDLTSRESFDIIIDRVPSLPVLLIITYRPEFMPPWVGRPHVTLLSLNRLSARQRAEMIGRVTDGKALPKEIVDQISDRTDGVPLFIEELTKAILESGALRDAGDHYTIAGSLPSLAIPTSLHASLLARLDRLPPAREVAQIGAALGRQFSHELISAVAPMQRQQLDEALSQLVSAELIFQRGIPPDAEYTFKHALVQETAYSTLLRNRRQQLHARIADVLEVKFPEVVETQPELLARHCTEGGLVEKAVDYRLRSGKQAFARGAMAEAEAELRNGLDLLYSLPDSAARQEQELNLQITVGTTLLATRGYAAPEAGEAFEHARQLCQKLNRPQQLNRVLTGQFFNRLLRGELEQAEFLAGELRRLGEAASDVSWKWNSLMRDGEVCCWLGKFIEARAYFEAALASWDPGFRDRITSPHDVYVNALIYLSRALFCLGYLDQARLRRDDALTEARRLSPYTEVYALRHAWYGDWAIEGVRSIEAMLRSAEHISVISSEQGFPMFVGAGDIMRGWCLSSVGEAKTGISLLEEGLKKYAATGTRLVIPFYLTVLAEAYGSAAQPKEGLNRLGDAAKLVETTQERWAEAEMHRVRGSLLLSLGERAAAEESYCEALAVARHQSAKFWELRAGLELGRLWRDQGKCIEARELLTPIYDSFTEGFDAPVLRDAKALLAQLR